MPDFLRMFFTDADYLLTEFSFEVFNSIFSNDEIFVCSKWWEIEIEWEDTKYCVFNPFKFLFILHSGRMRDYSLA